MLSLGALLVAPRYKAQTENDLTASEVLGLIVRDLARWLALHADPAGVVLLAPPNETTALCYYGGMRGLGALSWENKGGAAAAVLILGNPNLQKAKALIDRRKITHLVLLSWDSGFDDYTRAGTGKSAVTPSRPSSSWQRCPSGCGHWLIPCRRLPVRRAVGDGI